MPGAGRLDLVIDVSPLLDMGFCGRVIKFHSYFHLVEPLAIYAIDIRLRYERLGVDALDDTENMDGL